MPGKTAWIRIGAEGLVIVGSILLAFALDAWWDRRTEAEEERIILTDLRSDFEASLQGLERRWIPLHTAALRATQELLWLMARGDEPPPQHDGILTPAFIESVVLPTADGSDPVALRPVRVQDSIVGAALFTATYDPTLSSLEALLSSGSLSKVSNREVRALLAQFPAMLADLGDEERLARDHVYAVVRPVLHRQVNAVAAEMIGYQWMEAQDPIPAAATTRRTKIQASTELANTLSARFHAQWGVVSEAWSLRDSMEQMIALLDLELDDSEPAGR